MGDLVLRISPAGAVLGSVALSFSFVGSLYLWKLVGYPETNRDDTGTVQRRFLSALLSCVCSAALVYELSQPKRPGDVGFTLFELLGLQLDGLVQACVHALGLTAVLFVGPLAQHVAAVAMGSSPFVSLPGGPWVSMRNYVLAPFTEEFVFRACLVRLWVGASFPQGAIIFLSPFCFAMAHAHHFVEHVRRLQNKHTAMLTVAFQVFYTSLFGMYSNFLLLRIGSTVALILTHSFCNHQGFPDLSFITMERHPLSQHRRWLIVVYLIGIFAFSWLIMPMTAGFDSSFFSPDTAKSKNN